MALVPIMNRLRRAQTYPRQQHFHTADLRQRLAGRYFQWLWAATDLPLSLPSIYSLFVFFHAVSPPLSSTLVKSKAGTRHSAPLSVVTCSS
jgi:hypothetical protein